MKRDCQCPRARHHHGTVQAYRCDRCRCPECCQAAYLVSKNRRLKGGNALIDARQTQDHLDHLISQPGVSQASIARASGLSRVYIQTLMARKRHRLATSTARALLALTYDDVAVSPRVSSKATMLRLRALATLGYSVAAISRESGVSRAVIDAVIAGGESSIFRQGECVIAEVYERLWNVPALASTPQEQRAITAIRHRAQKSSWKVPMDIEITLQRLMTGRME